MRTAAAPWVLGRHAHDQLLQLGGDPRPPGTAVTLPAPVGAPSRSMPPHDGVGLDDHECASSAGPTASEQRPESAVVKTERGSTTAPRVDGELMPQCQVLEDEISAGADRSEECCNKQTKVEHRRASRGSPILTDLSTKRHGSGFALPRAYGAVASAPRTRRDDAVSDANHTSAPQTRLGSSGQSRTRERRCFVSAAGALSTGSPGATTLAEPPPYACARCTPGFRSSGSRLLGRHHIPLFDKGELARARSAYMLRRLAADHRMERHDVHIACAGTHNLDDAVERTVVGTEEDG